MDTNSKQIRTAQTIIRNPETGEEIFRGTNKVIISRPKMKKTVGKKRWARKFIRTHVNQMSAFLLTESIAMHGLHCDPDGSICDMLIVRTGLTDKWVDEHEWHPNEHFLYKVWYYADYTHKTVPKYLYQPMFTFIYLNAALQYAQEDGNTEMIDLIKQALKDYDYKTKIRKDPVNECKIMR